MRQMLLRSKRSHRSGGRMVLRSTARTWRRTWCSPGVPRRASNSDASKLTASKSWREGGQAGEGVNRGHRFRRVGHQRIVGQKQQALGLLAVDRLLQRVQREADHSRRGHQPVSPGIDGAALLEAEDLGQLEGVAGAAAVPRCR